MQHKTKRMDFAGRHLTDFLTKILSESGFSLVTKSERLIPRDIKEKLCYVALDLASEKETSVRYELPDGQEIPIGRERYQAPEALFNPSLAGRAGGGISKLIHDSIEESEESIRPELYMNVVLAGGSSLLPGLRERIEKDLKSLAPSTMPVRVIASPDRMYAAWVGGSVLGSLSTFQMMWITREEYEESGPRVVRQRCRGH